MLATADGCGTNEIIRRADTSKGKPARTVKPEIAAERRASLRDAGICGIEPDIGPFAGQGSVQKLADALVDVFAQLRDCALGYTHADAEVIAATLAGMTPNSMPGEVPRCVPVDIKRNRHRDRAVSVVVGTERILIRGKLRTVEVRACPVTFSPAAQQIDAAWRGYEDWWQALEWVRDGLMVGRMLREVEVTVVMPKVRPWGPSVRHLTQVSQRLHGVSYSSHETF